MSKPFTIRAAIVGLGVGFALFASACTLNPQPLPPEQPGDDASTFGAHNPADGSGGQDNTGSDGGARTDASFPPPVEDAATPATDAAPPIPNDDGGDGGEMDGAIDDGGSSDASDDGGG
jgi:hypothetical protein